jgi:hypothetical protein
VALLSSSGSKISDPPFLPMLAGCRKCWNVRGSPLK